MVCGCQVILLNEDVMWCDENKIAKLGTEIVHRDTLPINEY